jgi:hypothetical protein
MFDDSIRKPSKNCLKKQGRGREKWKYNGRSEVVQSILYVYVKSA